MNKHKDDILKELDSIQKLVDQLDIQTKPYHYPAFHVESTVPWPRRIFYLLTNPITYIFKGIWRI